MDKETKDFLEVGMSADFPALMIIDKDCNIEQANTAARNLLEKLTGSRGKDIVGTNIADLIPELRGNNRIYDGVFEINTDDIAYYMLPFRMDRAGSDDRMGILIVDAFAQKEIASELEYERETARDFEEILEGSFDGILVTDAEGKVLFVNSSYERVTEIRKSDLEGKYMRDLLNPVWMPESVAHIVARERTVVSKRQVVKSGRHIMVTGRPIFDS